MGSGRNGTKLRGLVVIFEVAGRGYAHEAAGLGHELVGFGAALDAARFGAVGPDGEQVGGQGEQEIIVAAGEFGR